MVARKLLTATAVGLSVGLLAQHATASEPKAAKKAPTAVHVVDPQLFRNDINAYVRELNRQMRETLNQELRRELGPSAVHAVNVQRARS